MLVKPWYRQFWVWFVIAWPAIAVVAGISTVIIAFQYRDDLVVDDYYRVGKAINQDLARDQAAQRLGLSAVLHYTAGQLQLTLTSPQAKPEPVLWLSLHHPTRAQEDQKLSLARSGDHYAASITALVNTHWQLQLTPPDQQWRLRGELALPYRSQAELLPSR
jgi:hypothetical protein